LLAVTSAEPGVGKTMVSANLAVALTELKQRVILLDADPGMDSYQTLLGGVPRCPLTLSSMLIGRAFAQEAVQSTPYGPRVLAAGPALERSGQAGTLHRHRLARIMRKLRADCDWLIVDCQTFGTIGGPRDLYAQDIVLVVSNPNPASLPAAYAWIKAIHRRWQTPTIGVLSNRGASLWETQAGSRTVEPPYGKHKRVNED
jgi:flagellar biosynthesis protein FlhG